MAIFHITPTTSVFKNDGTNAFEGDTTGADTLIVDPDAFLISTVGRGAFLTNTGAWTVTVNGSIISLAGTGIFLDAGNTALSTFKIGVNGAVQGANGIRALSAAKINNAGTIDAEAVNGIGIQISNDGTHAITNSGEIIAASGFAIQIGGNSNNTVTNSGLIVGTVALGGNTDVVTNSGRIDGPVFGGSDADTVTDFTILGDGSMKSGTMTGLISLGGGSDKFTGGANPETVQDGDGADVVSLGGGNDTYIATGNAGADVLDIIKGGAGIDTYDASAAVSPLSINLDSVSHGLLAANTATGTEISGTDKDAIFGFENVNGGAGSDTIFGSGANNVLNGGNGNDDLSGGAGKDQLTGGAGADTFHYTKLSDSGITAGTRDLIADFEQGIDKVDLSLIDADTTNAAGTNDVFAFIGTFRPFDGHAGQLHSLWTATGELIEGDVNGDKKADFSIEIQDPTHAITIVSTDFLP